MKRGELIEIIRKGLSECFEIRLCQNPIDAENSEFYRTMIDLSIAPKIADEILALQKQDPFDDYDIHIKMKPNKTIRGKLIIEKKNNRNYCCTCGEIFDNLEDFKEHMDSDICKEKTND